MHRRDLVCMTAEPEPLDLADPLSIAITAEQVEALKQALDQLDDVPRIIIILYFLEDMTHDEIGHTLGLNGFRAYLIMSDALTHLRGSLLS